MAARALRGASAAPVAAAADAAAGGGAERPFAVSWLEAVAPPAAGAGAGVLTAGLAGLAGRAAAAATVCGVAEPFAGGLRVTRVTVGGGSSSAAAGAAGAAGGASRGSATVYSWDSLRGWWASNAALVCSVAMQGGANRGAGASLGLGAVGQPGAEEEEEEREVRLATPRALELCAALQAALMAALEKSDITFNRGLLDGGAAAEANRGQRVGGVHEEPDVLLAKSPQTHRASTSAADGRPARGWLAKLRNKWPHLPQRRYFVLREGAGEGTPTLAYFASEAEAADGAGAVPRGVISLAQLAWCPVPASYASKQFCIAFEAWQSNKSREKLFVLQAPSQDEKDWWTRAIQGCLKEVARRRSSGAMVHVV